MKIYISIAGDRSVGIPDFETSMDLGIDDFDSDELEPIREKLIDCFSYVYNENVCVSFDFELENEAVTIFKQYQGI